MHSALVDLFGDSSDEDNSCVQIKNTNNNNNNKHEIVDKNVVLQLPPEIEEGNIEYKLKLIDPSPTRFEHLVTQMKWRLQEGLGEAIYEIGVEDNGALSGLTEEEMEKSLETLQNMALRLGASLNVIRDRVIKTNTGETRKAAEILVRKVPNDQQYIDVRVSLLGNAESGKSTLIGVLSQDELDNGRGKARLNLCRHLHEIQSGHTSSINHEILGFNNNGQVVNYRNCRTIDEICENSSKIITFIDLAGHHKYMKTTVCGLSGYAPDFAMLLISGNYGVAGTTKEHLGFSVALDVPVFIVINKIDICTNETINQTLNTIEFLLKSPGCSKIPFIVNNEDDAVFAAEKFVESNLCPIFKISCVTGENLNHLKKFLNVLPPSLNKNEREKLMQQYTEFRIDEVYANQQVGNIVAGMLLKGTIQEHEKLLLGPFEFGEFLPVEIQSVHLHRVPCRIVKAGQSAAINLGHAFNTNVGEKLRKGMVLVSEKLNPKSCIEFEADIYLLFHANRISKGFQVTVHIGNVCQTAIITNMDKDSIKTNEKARVKFKFQSRPEYVTIGSRIIFREGTTKGLGEVISIVPFNK